MKPDGWVIRTDRARLTESIIERVRTGGPIRIGDMLLEVWDGGHEPSQQLREKLAAAGLRIDSVGEMHGDWQVSVGAPEPAAENEVLF